MKRMIKPGEHVTWAIKSDYQDDFVVLTIHPHPQHQTPQGYPIMMARLRPCYPERFKAAFEVEMSRAPVIPLERLEVEVPLAMLFPVVSHSLH